MAEAGAERILYVVKAEGVEETAAAFEKLGASIDRTAKLQAAMEAAQEQSSANARIAAYQAEANAVNALGDAAGKQTQQVAAFESANAKAGVSTGQLREKVSAAGGAIGAFSQALMGVIPDVGGLNTAFGTTLRILPQLLGVLGGGGAGIAVGGLIAAVTGLGAVMSSASKDADKIASSTKGAAEALAEYYATIASNRAVYANAQSAVKQQKDFEDALTHGRAELKDYDAEIWRHTAAIEKNNAGLQTTVDMSFEEMKFRAGVLIPSMKAENEEHENQIKLLKEWRSEAQQNADLQKQQLKDKQDIANALASAGAAGTKQQTFDLGTPETLTTKPKDKGAIGANATNDFIQGQAEFGEVDEFAQKSKSALDHYAALKQAEEDWRATEGELITAAAEARNKSDIEQFENLKKLRDTEKAQTLANQQAVIGGLKTVAGIGASVTAKLITSAVEGQKVSGKAILASIGEAMIGEGTRAIFSGVIDLASLNPLGAVKIATGAAEIAAGVGFGAAGGGSTPSASSVSTPSQASTGEFGQSPYRDNSAGGGVVNNTTYVEFSSLTGPTAEDGLRVRQSLDKANNSYGQQI